MADEGAGEGPAVGAEAVAAGEPGAADAADVADAVGRPVAVAVVARPPVTGAVDDGVTGSPDPAPGALDAGPEESAGVVAAAGTRAGPSLAGRVPDGAPSGQAS
ncbi:hypothetical protein ACWES4_33125, partial [Streptomyces sp. NPDC004011]